VKRETLTTALLAAAMLAVGAVTWAFALRPPLSVDASALDALPMQLGPWQAEDVPLESAVESMLQADHNLQRRYRHELGDVVWVYVGYYGTSRGGRPEHTPRACFRAHGWEIEDQAAVAAGGGLATTELLVSRDGDQDLVQYWFRSFQRTGLRGGLDLMLDHLRGRVLHRRADGALVRISTPIDDEDRVVARSRLLQFAELFDRTLAEHWPHEAPDAPDAAGSAGSDARAHARR
jgi:EpsI family protein